MDNYELPKGKYEFQKKNVFSVLRLSELNKVMAEYDRKLSQLMQNTSTSGKDTKEEQKRRQTNKGEQKRKQTDKEDGSRKRKRFS